MMLHQYQHPFSGKTVLLNRRAQDGGQHLAIEGAQFTIEDWVDRMYNPQRRWKADDNWATHHFHSRASLAFWGQEDEGIDDVVYGKIHNRGVVIWSEELRVLDPVPIPVVLRPAPKRIVVRRSLP